MLNDVQRGYLAGMIDGEGNFSVVKHQYLWRRTYYSAQLKISNTNLEVLQYIKSIVGAGRIHGFTGRMENQKDVFCWYICSNELRKLLPQIVELLIIKRQQALLMIEFLKTLWRGGRYRSEEIHGFHEAVYQQMKKLNFRGVGEKEGEFGESLNSLEHGNTEPSRSNVVTLGVRNDYVPSSKEMI
jgi:hypothetical protein